METAMAKDHKKS